MADRSIIYGKGGGYLRASGEQAAAILRAAFEKHFANISGPTAVRLTVDEARGFPSFKGVPEASQTAWLVIVSDSASQSAYGLVQEGGLWIDEQVREAFAKARAMTIACETLLNMERMDGETAGSA